MKNSWNISNWSPLNINTKSISMSELDSVNSAVAYPGFSWSGCANSQDGCANLLFCNFLAENCIKMKEFGPRGRPWRPLRSATAMWTATISTDMRCIRLYHDFVYKTACADPQTWWPTPRRKRLLRLGKRWIYLKLQFSFFQWIG